MTGRGSTTWWCRASAYAALLLIAIPWPAAAQTPPAPPSPPWKDFVKTAGHDIEIPVQWVATPEGRFAHDIVLPPSIPRTVPFDFSAAKVKALKPGAPSVAKQYWEHLCTTEGGSFILTPVENVDGFFFMRATGGITAEEENNDRWKLEAPVIQVLVGARYEPAVQAVAFVQPPSATFEWVDLPDPTGTGVLHFRDYQEKTLRPLFNKQTDSIARYGIVWRGIRRPQDREHAISGYEWVAFDRTDMAVLGVLRVFYLTGKVRTTREGISWLNAGGCYFTQRLFGRRADDIGAWAPMVLQPKVKPGLLEALEKTRATEVRQ